MKYRDLVGLLLVAVAVTAVVEEQCNSRRATSRLSVSSGFNASGHWLATLRLETDSPAARPHPGRRLLLEAEPSSWRCGALRTDALVVTLQGPPKTEMTINPGYEDLGGLGFYKVHEELSSWEEAKATCEAEGAHLLILNSDEEAVAIQTLVNRLQTPSNWFHIGFRVINGVFLTLSGESLSAAGYNRWAPGEPHKTGELCGGITKTLGLVDIHCTNHKVMFICEQNVV